MEQALPIVHTRQWIEQVVVGCQFCPFAGKALLENKIRYVLVEKDDLETALTVVMKECQYLDEHAETTTTLLIFATGWGDFEKYLDMLEMSEELLEESGYEGVYQLASFHPEYSFDESDDDDPANYTNRSPYPMLHLLREEDLDAAIDAHPDAEGIPDRNVAWARAKGIDFMKALLKQSME